MARPKAHRSDLGHIEMVRPVQRLAFDALLGFRALLAEEDVKQAAKTDDRLFSTLLSLAFEEYGVKQADIADAMDLSAGVLGRWAKKTNLPVSALRPLVIETIAKAMDEPIKQMQADQLETDNIPRGRLVALQAG
jgi:hypothetical protein